MSDGRTLSTVKTIRVGNLPEEGSDQSGLHGAGLSVLCSVVSQKAGNVSGLNRNLIFGSVVRFT